MNKASLGCAMVWTVDLPFWYFTHSRVGQSIKFAWGTKASKTVLWLDLLKHDFHLIRKPVITIEADRPFLNNLKITEDVQNVLPVLLMSVLLCRKTKLLCKTSIGIITWIRTLNWKGLFFILHLTFALLLFLSIAIIYSNVCVYYYYTFYIFKRLKSSARLMSDRLYKLFQTYEQLMNDINVD